MSSKKEDKSESKEKEEAKLALEALEGKFRGEEVVVGVAGSFASPCLLSPCFHKQRTMNLKSLTLLTGIKTRWKKRRNSNGWRIGTTILSHRSLPKIYAPNCKRAPSDP